MGRIGSHHQQPSAFHFPVSRCWRRSAASSLFSNSSWRRMALRCHAARHAGHADLASCRHSDANRSRSRLERGTSGSGGSPPDPESGKCSLMIARARTLFSIDPRARSLGSIDLKVSYVCIYACLNACTCICICICICKSSATLPFCRIQRYSSGYIVLYVCMHVGYIVLLQGTMPFVRVHGPAFKATLPLFRVQCRSSG